VIRLKIKGITLKTKKLKRDTITSYNSCFFQYTSGQRQKQRERERAETGEREREKIYSNIM